VTFNYRVGGFGFMYIDGTDAKGNQALLDQNLELKWIYQNAARFGGDKSRITIAGQSAVGAL
jgi:carboxylesterase type B